MKTIIESTELYKIYFPGKENEIHALDGISLQVTAGELLAIVGQSGAGKTTLMHILGCLDTPTAGRYLLNGDDVSAMSDDQLSTIRNRHIGFIFQGFNLIPTLSAAENVELPLVYRGLSKDQRRRMVQDALEKVGLSARTHHRPGEMSGGQQQRVAIARAIVGNPPLILADEPTGNLDSKVGTEVMDTLFDLHRQGHTVMLITHDSGLAAKTNRVIRIHDGKISEDRKAS